MPSNENAHGGRPCIGLPPAAIALLEGAKRLSPCAGCRAPAKRAFVGKVLRAIRFIPPRNEIEHAAIRCEFQCACCGRKRTSTLRQTCAVELAWKRFVAVLAMVVPPGEPSIVISRPAKLAVRRLAPSRNDPDAEPIGIDEAISAILAVRCAANNDELFAALGIDLSGERLCRGEG